VEAEPPGHAFPGRAWERGKFGDVSDNCLCWIGRAGVPAGRGSMTGTEAGPTGKGRYPTYQNT